jgi:hypothetical protein
MMLKQGNLPVLLSCAIFALAQPAWAALGGTLETIQTDQLQMRAARRVSSRADYTGHELTLASGTVVREYVDATGTVFAVAWQGPFKPDLRQLLGTHFSSFVAAGQGPHSDHRMLKTHSADLVIESGGKMRAFTGRAYLPKLVPPNLSITDIR